MWRYTPGLDRWDKVGTLKTNIEAYTVTSGNLNLCQVVGSTRPAAIFTGIALSAVKQTWSIFSLALSFRGSLWFCQTQETMGNQAIPWTSSGFQGIVGTTWEKYAQQDKVEGATSR